MSNRLSGPEFHARDVAGWVHLVDRIATRLVTGDWAVGAQLVQQIAELADAQDHHPDLDLRYGHLDVTMNSHDSGGVTERDVRLARSINELAAAVEVDLDPRARHRLELALDTADFPRVRPFWNAVTGLALNHGEPADEVVDPSDQVPVLWFQNAPVDSGQRFHLDLWVAPEEVPGRIAAAVEAGGRLVDDASAPSFWVLADPDGNHVCLCTWQERS